MTALNGLPKKDEEIWEVLQLLNGDIYIYRKGFKEEADVKNIFKFNADDKENQFQRFGQRGLDPAEFSTVRLNRAVIAVAWHIADDSEAVKELKKIFSDAFPVVKTGGNG